MEKLFRSKFWLGAFTASLLLAKLYLSLQNGVLWPLSAYNMFAERLVKEPSIRMLRVTFDSGITRELYPWNVLPMDIYRSQNLLQKGSKFEQELLRAIVVYYNNEEIRSPWRSLPFAKSKIQKIEWIDAPNPFSLPESAR